MPKSICSLFKGMFLFYFRCKVPGLANDTYAFQNNYHRDLVNSSIPKKSDGSYEECLVVLNGSLERCTEWVYDRSVFTSTVNSQVRHLILRPLPTYYLAYRPTSVSKRCN